MSVDNILEAIKNELAILRRCPGNAIAISQLNYLVEQLQAAVDDIEEAYYNL